MTRQALGGSWHVCVRSADMLVVALLVAAALGATMPSARAACTPAAANNVTANCTGTTFNQGNGAPGTSTGVNGYGSGVETGVTVNVAAGATVTGTNSGIDVGDVTVNGGTGATIGSIITTTGAATVTNSGTMGSVSAQTNATVTNNAGATMGTITTVTGDINLVNSGSISGSIGAVGAAGNATVTNNAGGIITGPANAIIANGTATVINSGQISGTAFGIIAPTVNVINNAGGFIGREIESTGGGSSIINAGSINMIRFFGTGNTLTLLPGSTTDIVYAGGSDTLQLGGSGTATFDASALGPSFPARFEGFSILNKIGNSTWILTGTSASAFTGVINVNSGTLEVDGSLAGSATTVNSGGTLTGTGTVGTTTVANGGTLAPGNAANPTGMLMISGSLAFQSGAIYLVQVTPSAAASVSASGTTTLGGATVDAVFANGTYISKRYTILTASGGVSGTFGALNNTNLPANFSDKLSYDATHAYLDLTLNFTSVTPPDFGTGLSANQQAVANALISFFNSTGSIPLIYGTLTPAGLTQASGPLATASQQTTFDAMGQFMGLLTDPFMGRGNGFGGASSPAGYADESDQASAYAASRKRTDAFAMFTKAPPAPFVQRWSVWAAAYGGSQSTSGNAIVGSNDTTSRIAGSAVGADYLFSPNTLAGFALAGGGTSFSVNNLGSGRSDLFQAGAYVRHTHGPAYVTGALAYGWQDITTDRNVTIAGLDQLRAEFNANAYSGRVEGGYRFVAPWVGGIGVTPYAAGQFTTFDLPAYAESVVSGAANFALTYAAKSVTDSRSELGIRTDKSFAMPSGILTLRGRIAWAHDFDPNRSIAATFQALPGASFVVNGAAQASDSALTTASAEWKWVNGWSAAATFEGEFSNVTRSYAGKGVIRYAW